MKNKKQLVIFLLIVFLAITSLLFFYKYSQNHKKSLTIEPQTNLAEPKTTTFQHKEKNTAIIELLTNSTDVKQIVKRDKSFGFDVVYLYVAYDSKIFFPISNNNLAKGHFEFNTNNLDDAIQQYHEQGMKVVAVISSALWKKSNEYTQPNAVLLDPIKSSTIVLDVEKNLLQHSIDGIYIGEPYYVNRTVYKDDPIRSEHWNVFYQQALQNANTYHVPFSMLLPSNFRQDQGYSYGGYEIDNGISDQLTSFPFSEIGIDLETTYQTGTDQDLQQFQNMITLISNLARDKKSVVEISFYDALNKQPYPADFVEKQINIASKNNINSLVIFAGKFLDRVPDEYQKKIRSWISNFKEGEIEKN